MAKLPQPLHATVPLIVQAYESRQDDGLRPHLGCSIAGHECARFLWHEFRWVERAAWPGQMLRTFARGKLEEERVYADLRMIGVEVHADDGSSQYRVSAHGGHMGGSMDGVVIGLPESMHKWHVLEVKTANDKSWKALSKSGVEAAQFRHWCQMQLYMLLSELTRAVYISVNKNDDAIYLERVRLDKERAQALLDRAGGIIFSTEPPPRISDSREWWQCASCKYVEHCHGTAAPLVNCRTCAHSTPLTDGRWLCEKHKARLGETAQRAGCTSHRYIPALLERFAEMVDADGESVEYRNKLTGATFSNGELSSAEIRACQDKAMLGQERVDPALKELRQQFGGTYVG